MYKIFFMFGLLVFISFNVYSAERPKLSTYYGLNLPYELQLTQPKDELVSKSVSYQEEGVLDFEIIRANSQQNIEIDFNYGELNFTKIHKEKVYQTGTFYFKSEFNSMMNKIPLMGNERIYITDSKVKRSGCGGALNTLGEVLTLIEDLIDNGTSSESALIGSLMQAAMHAFNDLMACMRR